MTPHRYTPYTEGNVGAPKALHAPQSGVVRGTTLPVPTTYGAHGVASAFA